jgi:hypothetical protein
MTAMPAGAPPLLDVRNLRTWFHTERGLFKAVDGISFSVRRGRHAIGTTSPAPLNTRTSPRSRRVTP